MRHLGQRGYLDKISLVHYLSILMFFQINPHKKWNDALLLP